MVGVSAPGSVAVTRDIGETVSTAFHGESLGMMEVKGKGTVSIFGLRTRKP